MKRTVSRLFLYRMLWHNHNKILLWQPVSFIFAAVFAILASLSPVSLSAQENFTDHLTRTVAGEGTVTLHQDAYITALVNGKTPIATTPARRPTTPKVTTPKPSAQDTTSVAPTPDPSSETTPEQSLRSGRRTYVNGYRIQVYSGGNNRKSKQEAASMAGRVRSQFPEAAVYTHFVSPHWICRVGDFRTVEEANDLLRQMRATGQFNEAIVVKSKVAVMY